MLVLHVANVVIFSVAVLALHVLHQVLAHRFVHWCTQASAPMINVSHIQCLLLCMHMWHMTC